MDVTWESPFPLSRKRQVVLGSMMPVTDYTIVAGEEEITEPFGKRPEDSFTQDDLVSFVSISGQLLARGA